MAKKYAIVREFLYGYDWSEFSDDDGLIPIIYNTIADARAYLDNHINDVNDAYEDGDMDEPYENDMTIAEVTFNVIKHKHLSVEFIEDRLEVLGLDHPLVDQMSNEITKAIKELNQ